MIVNELAKDKCTGCYACSNICPKNCITMKRDMEGFVYPMIDTKQCIECGLCGKTCPAINVVHNSENTKVPKVFAAWSLNEKIRVESTSGGVFSELALNALKKNSYLCGAQYGKDHHIEHCVVNTEEGLNKIRQSKYAQSDVGDNYKRVKELLQDGQKVLFCGTPCECAGLINFLGRKYDNLTIVDFVCRGSNSPKVYEKFLKYLENKYQSKISRVWFKNKTYGWNRFSTKVEFENGQDYLEDRFNDIYIVGYIRYNLYMRPSCANCQYKEFPRVSDITLADFWGVKLKDQEKNIENGTSLVMINSAHGEEIFEEIKENLFYEEKTLKDTLEGNPSILTSPVMNPKREYFFKNLDRMEFDVLAKKCFREKTTWKTVIKKLIPRPVKKGLKKMLGRA